jgi:hypothetical protein
MATLAHPTSGEFGRPRTLAAGARAALERAVDSAPSRIPPPRGWMRRLFARDRSARALIERYRLWPEIEYAYERITRELGSVCVAVTAEDEFGFHYVAVDCFAAESERDRLYEFEQALWREMVGSFGRRAMDRILITIQSKPNCNPRP